ncbi:hypothetical protein ACWEWG_05555 [Streptomyces sp. NPDC003758]
MQDGVADQFGYAEFHIGARHAQVLAHRAAQLRHTLWQGEQVNPAVRGVVSKH